MALSKAEKKAIREEAEREAYRQEVINEKKPSMAWRIVKFIFWALVFYSMLQVIAVGLFQWAISQP